MDQTSSKIKDLMIGDLVTHILYGKEWIGVILGFKEEEGKVSKRHAEKALVQIQPGTKFEGFFDKKVSDGNRVHANLGFISSSWLFKLEVKNGGIRPSRNKTPPG